MMTKERYRRFIEYFSEIMPEATTELDYTTPYQMLVAVILSAQCTDKRVNMITPPFFKRFPDAESLSKGTVEEVYSFIKSCSYPNNKSKHLLGMAKMVMENFHGIVPGNVDELQKLPGVGRKTANVMASVVFNQPAMAVDTHVFRVSSRMGLAKNAKNPLQTEKQLVAHIPDDKLSLAHHWLILHGRYVCLARNPKCEICGAKNFCKYYLSSHKTSSGNIFF